MEGPHRLEPLKADRMRRRWVEWSSQGIKTQTGHAESKVGPVPLGAWPCGPQRLGVLGACGVLGLVQFGECRWRQARQDHCRYVMHVFQVSHEVTLVGCARHNRLTVHRCEHPAQPAHPPHAAIMSQAWGSKPKRRIGTPGIRLPPVTRRCRSA